MDSSKIRQNLCRLFDRDKKGTVSEESVAKPCSTLDIVACKGNSEQTPDIFMNPEQIDLPVKVREISAETSIETSEPSVQTSALFSDIETDVDQIEHSNSMVGPAEASVATQTNWETLLLPQPISSLRLPFQLWNGPRRYVFGRLRFYSSGIDLNASSKANLCSCRRCQALQCTRRIFTREISYDQILASSLYTSASKGNGKGLSRQLQDMGDRSSGTLRFDGRSNAGGNRRGEDRSESGKENWRRGEDLDLDSDTDYSQREGSGPPTFFPAPTQERSYDPSITVPVYPYSLLPSTLGGSRKEREPPDEVELDSGLETTVVVNYQGPMLPHDFKPIVQPSIKKWRHDELALISYRSRLNTPLQYLLQVDPFVKQLLSPQQARMPRIPEFIRTQAVPLNHEYFLWMEGFNACIDIIE